MDRWHGRHPIPWDFFYSFNDATGQDLNWFWNAWFFSYNYIDLAIENVKTGSRDTRITINNVGGFPIPFDVVVTNADGSTKKYHQTPAVWKANGKRAVITVPAANVQSVKLDNGIFMDATPADNRRDAR